MIIFYLLAYLSLAIVGNGLYGFVGYPIVSIFLVILSKRIFKKSFDSTGWIIFFVTSILCSITALVLLYIGHYWIVGEEVFGYLIVSMLLNLVPLIFLIAYLINFIIRLVHHKRLKKGENIASE